MQRGFLVSVQETYFLIYTTQTILPPLKAKHQLFLFLKISHFTPIRDFSNSLVFVAATMTFHRIFLLYPLFFIAFCHESIDSHSLPRPLILEYPENIEARLMEELRLECTSWRFAAETNNLSPWKTIPQECADYVKDYMNGREYVMDLRRVSEEAKVYAKGVELSGDGKDVWVFDIDETLLSNLPYYAEHGYGYDSGTFFNVFGFCLI